jgi:hypothetical protein
MLLATNDTGSEAEATFDFVIESPPITTTTTSIISTTTTTAASTSTTTSVATTSTTTAPSTSSSTTTSAIPSTTTSTPGASTTTTTVFGKPCPAKKALGEDNPKLENLRDFRDSKLAQSVIGRKAIQIYYNNADSINAALDCSPALRAATRRVLDVIAPMVGKK